LHHVLGLKWLIEELTSLSFSIPYIEVQLFNQSILQQQVLQSLSLPLFQILKQFTADNADSNIRTLDGTGTRTFHSVGIIAWYSHQNSQQITNQHVRCMARVKISNLIYDKGITIIPYITPVIHALSIFKFNPIDETLLPFMIPPVLNCSKVLWSFAKILGAKMVLSSNWSGFMHCVYQNDIDGISVMKC